MAQTDARAGFRLPWSSDRQSTDPSDGGTNDETQASADPWPTEDAANVSNATADAPTGVQVDPWAGMPGEPSAPSAPPNAPAPNKKPSKFLADLTKAMQTAAEDARSRSVGQLQADAKAYIEGIHGRSSTEAANLRRAADDDVAAVREWSKAEIARIREETETRITDRKARLETEIEEHAGVIEREIDAVQKTVTAFEDEMASFFERLLSEEDPTRFATMAENLPEPPSFEGIEIPPAPEKVEAVADEPVEAEAVAETVDAETDAEAVVETVEGEVEAIEATATTEAPETTEATGETTTEEAQTPEGVDAGETGAPTFEGGEGFDGEGVDGEVDREAAFAAIQAAAEAAASAEVAADAAARAEAVADVAIEIIGNHEDEESDPRFAALGISPDYDAAEAEALEAASHSDEDVPEIGDEAVAARLAGLVPGKGKGTGESTSTQLVVVGLVSVASIASFKRHLGRLAGVNSVGVSSGPDGEFVFAVAHNDDVVLRELVPSLPTFQARVTGSSDGVVHVTAHDPEADA